jgi:putative aldouronate transport system permease protein
LDDEVKHLTGNDGGRACRETAPLFLSPELLKQFEDMKTLLRYSVIVEASLPALFVYPLAQKYFVKGFMIGSVKE